MAHGLPSDFSSVLFNQQIAMSFQERLAKNLAVFNAAGGDQALISPGAVGGELQCSGNQSLTLVWSGESWIQLSSTCEDAQGLQQ